MLTKLKLDSNYFQMTSRCFPFDNVCYEIIHHFLEVFKEKVSQMSLTFFYDAIKKRHGHQ